jgi:hypothetical protein
MKTEEGARKRDSAGCDVGDPLRVAGEGHMAMVSPTGDIERNGRDELRDARHFVWSIRRSRARRGRMAGSCSTEATVRRLL